MTRLRVLFAAGSTGRWRIERLDAVVGDPLPPAGRLAVLEGDERSPLVDASWVLHGVTSNERYVN